MTLVAALAHAVVDADDSIDGRVELKDEVRRERARPAAAAIEPLSTAVQWWCTGQ